MMKKKQKIIIALTTILVIAMAGQSFAASCPFTDIEDTKQRDVIIALHEQDVIKGIGYGLFDPDGTLTAAQGMQMIVNAFDITLAKFTFIKAPQATDWFKNAKDNAWYADAFIRAGANNIGLPADLDPNAIWTKEDFTYYLVKAMDAQYIMPATDMMYINIADENDISAEYRGIIQRSLKYNITELDQDKKFYPKKILTRAEAAEMIYNGRALVSEMNLEFQ